MSLSICRVERMRLTNSPVAAKEKLTIILAISGVGFVLLSLPDVYFFTVKYKDMMKKADTNNYNLLVATETLMKIFRAMMCILSCVLFVIGAPTFGKLFKIVRKRIGRMTVKNTSKTRKEEKIQK